MQTETNWTRNSLSCLELISDIVFVALWSLTLFYSSFYSIIERLCCVLIHCASRFPSLLFVFVMFLSLSFMIPSFFPFSPLCFFVLSSVRQRKFGSCEVLWKEKWQFWQLFYIQPILYCAKANNWWKVPFHFHPTPFTLTTCG